MVDAEEDGIASASAQKESTQILPEADIVWNDLKTISREIKVLQPRQQLHFIRKRAYFVVSKVENSEVVRGEGLVGKLRQAHTPHDHVSIKGLRPVIVLVVICPLRLHSTPICDFLTHTLNLTCCTEDLRAPAVCIRKHKKKIVRRSAVA